MAFTAQLGTSSSQLGNIEPGQGAVDTIIQQGGPGSDGTLSYGIAAPHPTLSGTATFDPPRYTLRQSFDGGTGTTHSFSSTPLVGDLIVVSGRVTACSDNQGNTYHFADGNAGTAATETGIWYAYNVASSGTFTITVTLGTSGTWGAAEFTGFGPNDPLKGHNASNNTNSGYTIAPSNPVPTDHQGVIILSDGGSTVLATPTVTSVETPPWTNFHSGTAFQTFGYYRMFATTASITVSVSFSGSATWSAAIAYFVNPQDAVGSSVGTSTAAATGFPIYEGGHILLETGDSILLETGDFALLESTTDGGAASSSGTATVSGVGYSTASGVGSAAGVATVSGVGAVVNSTGSGGITIHHPTFSGSATVGINGSGGIAISHPSFSGAGNTNVIGSGGITINAPSFSGSAQAGVSASGGITISHPTLSGSTRFTNPDLLLTQFAAEDQEEADTQTAQLTQFAAEDIEEFSDPQIFETQYAVEDQEEFSSPKILLDQYVVEILIPFDCNLTPPLTLPPGCPPNEIEGTGSNHSGCEENSVEGTGSSSDGCVPFVKDI